MRLLSKGLLAVWLPITAWADIDMKPGLWDERTILPDGSVSSEQKCYLPKDIANTDLFQHGRMTSPDGMCVASSYTSSGNTVKYTLICTAAGASIETQVTATYMGDHAEATVSQGKTVTKMTRKRVGDCTKSSFDR